MDTLIIKLVLTGGSGVGKTGLLLTYTKGKLPSCLHTIGVGCKIVETHVDGRAVEAQIWDPSGGVSSSNANTNSNNKGNNIITVTSHECHGVSNHRSLHCLFYSPKPKKT